MRSRFAARTKRRSTSSAGYTNANRSSRVSCRPRAYVLHTSWQPTSQPPARRYAFADHVPPFTEGEGGTRGCHKRTRARRRRRQSAVSRPPIVILMREKPATTETTRADENRTVLHTRYKIGDTFFHLPLEQAQEMLSTSTEQIDEDVSELEEKLSATKEEMTQLKVDLYARFGRSINLET